MESAFQFTNPALSGLYFGLIRILMEKKILKYRLE